MRIVPPAPNIVLYEDGFKKFDLLERRLQGKQLSDLVEKIEDPLVIAIDGRWGGGKSFFLKCWVGAHKIENNGSAETVYFDAFENDFLDDPLISLTSAIASRLTKEPETAGFIKRAKSAAAVLGVPAARIALAVVTAGASESAGTMLQAGIDASHGELDKRIESFWKQEECQRAAMRDFRDALTALTLPNGESGESRKLVVTIDELDRCRPDYALSVLEVIKHFFNVPNVHFVLGVNLEELANSVRARYGESTNAHLYLQKFISVTLNLSTELQFHHGSECISKAYFLRKATMMNLNDRLIEEISLYLERPQISNSLSLRAVERILTQMALVPHVEIFFKKRAHGYWILLSGLIVMKILFPINYKAARENTISMKDVRQLFSINIPSNAGDDHIGDLINQTWVSIISPEEADQSDYYRKLGLNRVHSPIKELNSLIRDFLETIKLGTDTGGQ